jgi:putative redox protein
VRTVTIALDSEGSRFVAQGSLRGQPININAPRLPGEQRGPTGFSATELLLAAAGSCAAWDVLEIMRKRRQELAELEVTVEGEQADEAPWRYERVTLHFKLRALGLRPAIIERVIRLSCVRYCSVLATLRGVARVAATMELIDLDGASSGRLPVSLALEPAEPIDETAAVGVEPPITDED